MKSENFLLSTKGFIIFMKDFVGTFSPSIDIQIKFSGVAALKFHMDTSNYHICKEEDLQMFSSHFVGIGSQARICPGCTSLL